MMPEETETTVETEPTDPGDETGSSGSSPSTDWGEVADLIAEAIQQKQATYEIIPFGDKEYRVHHEATIGDLLVSLLLMANLSIFLLKWLFQAVWRR